MYKHLAVQRMHPVPLPLSRLPPRQIHLLNRLNPARFLLAHSTSPKNQRSAELSKGRHSGSPYYNPTIHTLTGEHA
jgi:hypothetical protein